MPIDRLHITEMGQGKVLQDNDSFELTKIDVDAHGITIASDEKEKIVFGNMKINVAGQGKRGITQTRYNTGD